MLYVFGAWFVIGLHELGDANEFFARARQTTVLFSRPGYDWSRFEAERARLKEGGNVKSESLPVQVATTKAGDRVRILDRELVQVNGVWEDFLKVEYTADGGRTFTGYAYASFFDEGGVRTAKSSGGSAAQRKAPSSCPSASCAVPKKNLRDMANEAMDAVAEYVGRLNAFSSLKDPFFNPEGCFSKARREANECTHPEWLKLSLEDRARLLLKGYREIISEHQFDYDAEVLTCKAVRETCLRPQDQTPVPISSAVGLPQATRTTIRDLLRRADWFQPRVRVNGQKPPQFATLDDVLGWMERSILVQMEVGTAIFHQKALDHNLSPRQKSEILMRYYGHPSPRENRIYASKIMDCARCVQRRSAGLRDCLLLARPECKGGLQ